MASGDGVGDELHSGKQDLGFGRTTKKSTCFSVQMGLSTCFSVKMTTLRFMLGVVAAENLELFRLDVKTTFLHGDLTEEIYMEQLKGFVASG